MNSVNYKTTDKSQWAGRVDSDEDFDAFRWHQWIKFIDLNNDSLKPFNGQLGFCFIGFCCDKGISNNLGRVGAAKGPCSIRKEMSNLPCSFGKGIQLFDAGDVFCNEITLDESQSLLADAVKKIISLNLFPIVLGGGHEVALGNYLGILKYLLQRNEKPKIGIINFDAHFDLRNYNNGSSSGTMFKQIADICNNENINYSYFCLGVQKHSNTLALFNTADKLGVKYVLAKDIIDSDNWRLFEKLEDFIKLQDKIHITICSDVFSTAYAPGVSAPQPLGLDPERVLKFLKYIVKSDKVISFDIAEVSPRFDLDNTTANLASVIIYTLVNALSKNSLDCY